MARLLTIQAMVIRGKKARKSTFEISGRIDPSKNDAVWGIGDLHRLLADEGVDEVRLKVIR